MLETIRIVLVETSHPGNIGATVRAMKNMGLNELYLVNPATTPSHELAIAMASGAKDILDRAIVVTDLATALAGCTWVVGTSARDRTIPWPKLTPRAFANQVMQRSSRSPIAILFGRERIGLLNEELHYCHYHLSIPSCPDYSSLNLAQAVQIVAYELYVASLAVQGMKSDIAMEDMLAPAEDVIRFYQHLEMILEKLDFLKPEAPRQLMTRLKRLFQRAQLETMELNILRGILTAIEKKS